MLISSIQIGQYLKIFINCTYWQAQPLVMGHKSAFIQSQMNDLNPMQVVRFGVHQKYRLLTDNCNISLFLVLFCFILVYWAVNCVKFHLVIMQILGQKWCTATHIICPLSVNLGRNIKFYFECGDRGVNWQCRYGPLFLTLIYFFFSPPSPWFSPFSSSIVCFFHTGWSVQ